MKKNAGFTLIELLVVVLIIGILASVALPQYEKAVEKSRASEAVINLRALVNAQQLYKMAHGAPAQELDALDLQITGEPINAKTVRTPNFTYNLRNFNANTLAGFEAVANRNDNSNNVMKYYVYFSYSGKMYCVAKHRAAESICGVLCGNSNFADHSSGCSGCRSCKIQ